MGKASSAGAGSNEHNEEVLLPCPPGLLPQLTGSLEEGLTGGLQALCGCPDLPTAAQELCHCLRGLLAIAAADTPTSKAASEAGSASSLSDQQRAGHTHDAESEASTLPENGMAKDTRQHLAETQSAPARGDIERHPQPAGDRSEDGSLSMQPPDDLPQQWQRLFLAVQAFALTILAGAAPPQLLAALSLQRYGLQLLEDRGLSLPPEALDRLLQPASTFAALR